MHEVKAVSLKRGCILVGIGRGITGDIQINDTDIQSPLKKRYQELQNKHMIA